MKHISDIKHKNKQDIIQLLYKKHNMSKKRIAIELELSPSVITKLCTELLEEGIILESEPIKTKKAGRKEIEIQINPAFKKCFGIVMNHKNTTILLTDMNLNVLYQKEITTDSNAKKHLDTMINLLSEVINEMKLDRKEILGIGISIKGNTDGIYAYFGIWDYKVNVKDYIEENIGIPVSLDNGIRCSAMLEQLHCMDNNFIFIKYMEPGIGGAIVQNGEIGLGETHSILDFGHLIVDQNGDYCSVCKRKGCLENTISFEKMIAYVKENFSYANFPVLYNICEGEANKITIQTMIESAENGCIKINRLFKKSADYFAMCIVNTYALLDTKKIIVIGDLFSSERYLHYFKSAIYEYQLTELYQNIEIHEHENELLSAIVLALNTFLFHGIVK